MRVRYRIDGLIALNRKLGPDLVAKPVERFLTAGTRLYGQQIRADAPRFTGQLAGSFREELQNIKRSGNVAGFGQVRSSLPHARAVATGTAPHMPPVASLEAWAKAKGLSPWAVAISIRERGTRPGQRGTLGGRRRRWLAGARRTIKPRISALLDEMGRDILTRWQGRS